LAFLGDALACDPYDRPRVHGLCGRSVLDSRDDYWPISRGPLARSSQRAAVRSPAAARRMSDPRLSHPAERIGIDRRRFLAASGGALGAMVLAACDSMGPRSATSLLKFAERKNETLERALFRHTAMDVPPSGATAAGSRFPSYFIPDEVPVWDDATRGAWRLALGGMVSKPLQLSL